MPFSGEAPFYDGVIGGLDSKQLARVVLEFLSLVCLERRLVRWVEGLLGLVGGVLGLALSLVLAW